MNGVRADASRAAALEKLSVTEQKVSGGLRVALKRAGVELAAVARIGKEIREIMRHGLRIRHYIADPWRYE